MDVGEAITEALVSVNEPDANLEPANVADGLFAISRSIDNLAKSVERLGLNGAHTNKGAIELLCQVISESGGIDDERC